jgi:hypothetical protein
MLGILHGERVPSAHAELVADVNMFRPLINEIAVTKSIHDRGHGQAFIGKGVCVGFSESVKFAEEVSLHTADGVGEDQIAGLGAFRNHPVP